MWLLECGADPRIKLTTFNSPFGRYRFLRMPFGLKMAQDVFQSKIDQTFEGCEGVIGISDDIVVFGTTEAEHDRHMHEMLTRCKATGLKLNPDKCRVKESKIKFYGIICDTHKQQLVDFVVETSIEERSAQQTAQDALSAANQTTGK